MHGARKLRISVYLSRQARLQYHRRTLSGGANAYWRIWRPAWLPRTGCRLAFAGRLARRYWVRRGALILGRGIHSFSPSRPQQSAGADDSGISPLLISRLCAYHARCFNIAPRRRPMTPADTIDNTLIDAGETIGATAGKVVASAKRTAAAIGEQKERLAGVATQARSETRRVVKQGKREARKAVKSAKKVAASAKKSIKRVARKLKRS